MALARLPDPAREDKAGKAVWPLENKGFLVSHMDFEIVHRTADQAILEPRFARILHSDEVIDLRERFRSVSEDFGALATLRTDYPELAGAIGKHHAEIAKAVNSANVRKAADAVIALQTKEFGLSNAAAVSTIVHLPPTQLEEDIGGKEGRILTRLHSFKERNRSLVKKAKFLFKNKHGKLYCECCGFESGIFYGKRGEDRIQAHHRRPIEELLPDSITKPEDLAMVCPNCHDIIHAKRPWISVEALREELKKLGSHYFK